MCYRNRRAEFKYHLNSIALIIVGHSYSYSQPKCKLTISKASLCLIISYLSPFQFLLYKYFSLKHYRLKFF